MRQSLWLLPTLASLSYGEWINSKIEREISIGKLSAVEARTVYSVKRGKLRDNAPYLITVPAWSTVGSLEVQAADVKAPLQLGRNYHLQSVSEDDYAVLAVNPDHVSNSLTVTTMAGKSLAPFPAKVMEQEAQRVLLSAHLMVPSKHETESQTTVVTLPRIAGAIESVRPSTGVVSDDKKKITFGPFTGKEVTDRRREILKVHFGYNTALPYISSVIRTIDLSHLAATASVHESVRLQNGAAGNAGEFNRIPFTHIKYNGANSPFNVAHTMTSMDAVLPINAAAIHYRDVIGNISTSNARREKSFTRVSIKPRFPLLGGWKTEFDLMYTIPFIGATDGSVDVLSTNADDGSYLLSIPAAHAFTNVFAKHEEIVLVLPSGSSDIQVSVAGRDILEGSLKTRKTFGWLDTPLLGPNSGRTVVSFSLGGVLADGTKSTLRQDLLVKYRLSRFSLYKAPLLLSLYIFAIFAALILSRRMAMQINNPKETSAADIASGDAEVCQQIDDHITKVANTELLEAVGAHAGKKPELEAAKKAYVEILNGIVTDVETITESFVEEKNKGDRTQRLLGALKQARDTAATLADVAGAGKDSSSAAQRLVDSELEIKRLIWRVANNRPTPPGTPTPASAPGASSRKRK